MYSSATRAATLEKVGVVRTNKAAIMFFNKQPQSVPFPKFLLSDPRNLTETVEYSYVCTSM